MAGPRSSIDVFLSLHGQRKFAKEVAASGAELEALGLKGAKAMARFAASGERLKRFGKSWTHNVSLPIAGLGVIAGYSAVNFKRQMGLISTDAGGTAKEVGVLEKSVLGLTRETQYGPTQLAEALFHVESAGYRGAKAMKVLRESAKLATAGNSDLEETTYALVSANKALNEGESLKGITKTAAQMNEIVAHGDIRLEELTAAMSTGLFPTAKALGLKVADVGSALDIMTARGIPAQKSAYALNFTLQKLIPSTDKASEAFAHLGIGHEELLKISQRKGLPWGLERLKQAMHGLSKGQQIQKIDEMFGGGRMSKGLLVIIQHLGEAKQKWHEVNGDVALYKKHVKEAEEQPLVKLKKAWSGIQASLVEIGNDLMPIAGPALEKLAKGGEKLSHAFLSLPGPVQAATVAFLVLTGPVASGLGYFANGIGRALILTTKLAGAAKDFSIFTTALKAGQGLSGSASMAFGTYGESAAMQTAKGFVASLGPAVAAYGIGNILTSSLSGDWKDAGFEAGGAIAGGIAGFMLGGPMGAMLGVGLGSLGGELLSGLFNDSSISPLREKLNHLKDSTEGYRRALAKLPKVEARVDEASKLHRKAVKAEQGAHHKLIRVLARYGGQSRQAAEAQYELDRAQRKVTHSANREKKAEHLNKYAARAARQELTKQVASIKQVLPGLKKRAALARKEADHAPHKMGLQKRAAALTEREIKLVNRLPNLYKRAAELGGKSWANRLKEQTTLQAQYGVKGKVLIQRIGETKEKMQILASTGLKTTKGYEKQMEALAGLRHQYELINELGTPKGVGSVEGRAPHRAHPSEPHKSTRHRPATHGRRNLPQPHRLQIAPGSLNGALNIHLTSHHVIELEGKPVAEETTRQVKRKQLLE